ncbi:TIGR04282 family arsenosugar biosynthesis glycosyltransferase [Pareuzebyella sediminis]|uniref:TIGR04282 family arsenosugar biosynthesis glycosyltransferase n=1 Tax=Pareuzebyella sediminis TaxID=2607998 RepID=UPI0011EF052E|nr:DUF2064 domain-containing protein [Pareuzebyella sediminis]
MHFSPPPNTCVLIFALSSQKEALRKGIVNGEGLFNELTRQTILNVQKTKLPYIHCTENLQKGDSFGERFVNAITSVFEAGYEIIITIGNDAPQLKPEHIFNAYGQLLAGKSVLGPSVDGGFYLMGLQKKDFRAADFEQLPWHGRQLLDEVTNLLSTDQASPEFLERLNDLDHIGHIKLILSRTKVLPKNLVAILLALINSFFSEHKFIEKFYSPKTIPSLYNKGSPLV